MQAQNILPEQIFFPPYADFIAFHGDLHSTERPEEWEMLCTRSPQEQGAGQEPLWLVQLMLVDSSACSDNEATQAAV